ncbi:MAG: hypothetical protein Q8O87_03435 [bacterium]|nr:hypothetical protein [bacterium]
MHLPFSKLDFGGVKNAIILLDIDGTLVPDGGDVPVKEIVEKCHELVEHNKVYLLSNKKNHDRNEAIAGLLHATYINTPRKKPSRKVLGSLDMQGKSLIVVGDKFLTDGILAKRIGARFIKAKRIVDVRDGYINKTMYALDDLIYQLFKSVVWRGRSS